jgi:hypothetical protein
VLIRSSNQSPSWQLRFIQARNLPELLHSTRSGFSSPLTADSPFAFGARERARGTGEFCLRRQPFGRFLEEPDQPTWSAFSPVTRDYPGNVQSQSFNCSRTLRSFNELRTS